MQLSERLREVHEWRTNHSVQRARQDLPQHASCILPCDSQGLAPDRRKPPVMARFIV